MYTPYGLNLQRGEKILWMGKRCLASLWLPFLIGVITLVIYGIGVLFIAYAIVTWLKVDYVVTDKRVAKVTRHYAFVYLISYDLKEIRHEEIKSVYTIQSKMGKSFYFWDLIIENGQKIVFKGIKEPEEVKRILKSLQ